VQPAQGVFSILERMAASPGRARTAIEFQGRRQSFAELAERATRLANGLAALGVRAGDRVAVLMANRLEWPEAMYALAGLGAVLVPVNVLLRPPEIEHVLAHSGSTCLIADEAAGEAVAALAGLPLLVRVGALEAPPGARSAAYEEVLAGARARMPWAGPGLEEAAVLFYTSGTTGRPKAAEHTHGGLLWNTFTQIPDLGLGPEDTYLVVPSLSWAAGFHDLVLPLAWIGGRSVLMPTGGTSVERIALAAEGTGATHVLLVPTLLKQLLSSPADLARLRGSRLRWIISGAEPVPRPVIAAMNDELPGANVVQGYGLSEFPTIATALRPEEAIPRAGSAGRPLSIVTLAVESDAGAVSPLGEGEVLIRSPATMRGYYRLPEETAETLRDGWLHTGDLGVVDDEGYLTITGRKKDMIVSGGLNVYPKEVEEVIYQLAGVAEAAVVGVPDERWGEVPVAVVVADPAELGSEAVEAACRVRLASYKCPRHVLLRDEPLPRNPSGKVLKRELRPWAARALGIAAP
jgi:fatty-acyl-CoA synthase